MRVRAWKFLLVPVLFGAIGMFVYSAFQFTDPRFSFVPKVASISRSYVVSKSSPPGPDELHEVSVFEWKSDYGTFLQSYHPEIQARGFAEVKGGGALVRRMFLHKSGDAVVLEYESGPPVMTRSGVCVTPFAAASLTFVHVERRGGYAMVKRMINWFRRL